MRLGRAVPVLTLAGALALGGCGPWVGGIHAVLRYRRDEQVLVVEQVPPRGPAARAGLRPDDRIVAIDGEPVSVMTPEQVRERLRGEVGTRVRLRVVRDGAARDVEVERAPYRGTQL